MDLAYTIGPAGVESGATAPLVPWWSFTKTVIAAASFKAAEAGLLDLDEPAIPGGGTLRQLLHHTSGLPDYGEWLDYHAAVAAAERPWPVDVIIERGTGGARPAGGFHYSNIGYAIVNIRLVEATGRRLGELIESYVLEPAGATSARLVQSPGDLAGVAGAAPGYDPGWVYHGLLVGELRDAARVIRALLSGELVSPPSLRQMLQVTALPQFQTELWREPAYGAGLMAPCLANGRRLIGHTGEGPGSDIAAYAMQTSAGPAAAAVFTDSGSNVEQRAATLLENLSRHEVR